MSSTATGSAKYQKLKLGGLVAVLYAYCAAGPFAFEDMVTLSGPGMTLIFIAVLPWLFSLPMSLATAEMATAMPVQGGFYRWTRAAFGDFWGFQCGWWNWSGTFLMNGAYAVGLADYTAQIFPAVAGGYKHWLVAILFLVAVALLNIRGVHTVGNTTIILLFACLIPVVIFTVIGFANMKVNPMEPLIPPGKGWREVFGSGLALGLWLYSGYEQLSTNTEEVERPQRNFPLALAIIVPLAMLTFLLPYIAGLGASADWQKWTSGYIIEAARNIGGNNLALAMAAAATVALLLGLESTLLSSTRLPFTMAEDGYFHPKLATLHPKYQSPVAAILLTSVICGALASLPIAKIIPIYIWLRATTSMLTLLSVWKLRQITGDAPNAYRIPGGKLGLALVIGIPGLLFAWMLINSDPFTMKWAPVYMAMGPIAYVILRNLPRKSDLSS